jgi:hypothetical protein
MKAVERSVRIEVATDRVSVERGEDDILELQENKLQSCERRCPNDGLVKK